MREFHDPSLTEQIARDRYLLDRPEQAMKRLLEDFDELARLAKKDSNGKFDEAGFEDMLSILEFGMCGLLKLAFNPSENDFFVKKFRGHVRKTVESFMRDVPDSFRIRLNQLAYGYPIASRLKVKKPILGVKKYIAGVATAVAGVLGLGSAVPLKTKQMKSEISTFSDNPATLDPQPIEVTLSTSFTQFSEVETSFESPYYASLVQSAKEEDDAIFHQKETQILAFKERVKNEVETGKLDYRRFFFDLASIVGTALPHDVASAEKNLQRLVDELRPKVQNLPLDQYLQTVAPYIGSPKSKRDDRNKRSYLTDLFNDLSLNGERAFIGNCEARTSAYLTLTQLLRPDLLSMSSVQVFKDHVRFVMKDDDIYHAVDGRVQRLDSKSFHGSALASPQELFVEPFLTGEPYNPPESFRDRHRYEKSSNIRTDTLLPRGHNEGLKTWDEEREEELIIQGATPEEAKKIVESDSNLDDGEMQTHIFRPQPGMGEEDFIREIEGASSGRVQSFFISLGDLPLTPRLVRALSSLHGIRHLEIGETGFSPISSPLIHYVHDSSSSHYYVPFSDLASDLLRKAPFVMDLLLPKLQFASHSLKQSVGNLHNLRKLYLSGLMGDEFQGVVPLTAKVRDDFFYMSNDMTRDYIVVLRKLRDRGFQTNDAPLSEHVREWLLSLPFRTKKAIFEFSKPAIVLIPPGQDKSPYGILPNPKVISRVWEKIHNPVWRFGVTDIVQNSSPVPGIFHSPGGELPLSEVLEKYRRHYEASGMTLLPPEAYIFAFLSIPLVIDRRHAAEVSKLQHSEEILLGYPDLHLLSTDTVDLLDPPAGSSDVPLAILLGSSMQLAAIPLNAMVRSAAHFRPWIEGK